MTEKKKKSAEAPEKADLPVSQLLLDCTKDKYRLVGLATRWAYEIKQRDQSAEPPQELINTAVKEILTGQVSMEEIEKLPPLVKVEKKPEVSIAAEALSEPPPMPEKTGKGKKKGDAEDEDEDKEDMEEEEKEKE